MPNNNNKMNRSRSVGLLKILTGIAVINFSGHKGKKHYTPKLAILTLFLLSPFFVLAQSLEKDSLLTEVTLKNAIDYAILHQPKIQQSLVDQEIVETTIKNKLSEWYPQINFNFNQQHNFIVPQTIIGGNVIKLGSENSSAGQFTVSQTIFNNEVMLVSRSKNDVRLQATQVTSSNKIELAVDVSKAFYDILFTIQQIKVTESNIFRIGQSLKDAYNQYKAGIVDKIDYKRATITLNNAKANKRTGEELLQAKLEYLKSLMGYPLSASLNIVYDSLQLEKEIMLDTLQTADYSARIEYKLLSTRRTLLESNLKYNKWSYLPTVSANGAYNLSFQSNKFNQLYTNSFPSSFAAISLGIPIFQGGKRKAGVQAAELELKRNELDFANLKNEINAGYAQAMAVYKSNLVNYLSLKENLGEAKEVYNIIQLQYRSGIKSYLEVISAENDIRSSEINYYTAMYQLLVSKIEVQKALGQINY
jgi:outer membrane protein